MALPAVGWRRTATWAAGVVASTAGSGIDQAWVRGAVVSRHPADIVRRLMREVPELPLNTNGKVGRRALEALLEAAANPCRQM
jgi:hypothetical protein